MENLTVILHEIAKDGLPDMDEMLCRVAFFWDGNIVNGWPITPEDGVMDESEFGGWPYLWEADSDPSSWGLTLKNGGSQLFSGVTHWIEFPQGLHLLSPPAQYVALPKDVEYVGGVANDYDIHRSKRPLYAHEAAKFCRQVAPVAYTIHLYQPKGQPG